MPDVAEDHYFYLKNV